MAKIPWNGPPERMGPFVFMVIVSKIMQADKLFDIGKFTIIFTKVAGRPKK